MLKAQQSIFFLVVGVANLQACSCSQISLESKDPLHSSQQLGSLELVHGVVRSYRKEDAGKGAGVGYFRYAIELPDKSQVPISKRVTIDPQYLDRKVQLRARIGTAPLHQKQCPPYCQNAMVRQIQEVLQIQLQEP